MQAKYFSLFNKHDQRLFHNFMCNVVALIFAWMRKFYLQRARENTNIYFQTILLVDNVETLYLKFEGCAFLSTSMLRRKQNDSERCCWRFEQKPFTEREYYEPAQTLGIDVQ